MWVASARESWTMVPGAVVRVRDGVATRFAFPAPVSSTGRDVWGTREGEPWIRTVEGVHRFDGTAFRRELEDVQRILVGPNGQLSVETREGFRRWNGSSFEAPVRVGDPVCIAGNGDIVERVGTNLVRRTGAMTTLIGPVPVEPVAQLYCAGRSVVAAYGGRTAMLSMDTGAAVSFAPPANVAAWRVSTHGELFVVDNDRHVYRVEESGRTTAVFDLPDEVSANISELVSALDVDPASGAAYAIVSSNGGYAYRYERGAWLPRLANTNVTLRWFWGTAGRAPDIAFGPTSFATRDASGQWTFQSYPMTVPNELRSMAGLDANNVLFSTGAGALVRWNRAMGFSVVDAGAQIGNILLARSESDVWASSAAGLRHWNGSAWSTTAFPAQMQGISSLVEGEGGVMFAIFAQVQPPGVQVGTLFRFDGTTFTPEEAPTGELQWTTLDAGELIRDDAGALWMRLSDKLFVRPRGAATFTRIENAGMPLLVSNITPTAGGVIASGRGMSAARDYAVVDSATRTVRPIVDRPYVRNVPGGDEALWSIGSTQLWIHNDFGGIVRFTAR